MCQALLEIMQPEINQIVEAAVEKAVEKAEKKSEMELKQEKEKNERELFQTAKKMVKTGKISLEEIKEYFPGLSVEMVGELTKMYI